MPYTRTVWEDTPSTNTPVTAANLNNMESGIESAHTQLAEHQTEISTNQTNISSLTSGKVDYYNAGAGDLNSFKLQNTHTDVAVYTLKGGYTHAPTDLSGNIYGYMTVGRQAAGSTVWIEQTLYVNGKIYHRRYTEYNSSGSWSSWVRLATSGDIADLQRQIDNLPTIGVRTYGAVSFAYNGATESINGTGVIE